jgi:hypothetical protein
VLGILGREGVDVANRWVSPQPGTPTYKAFQMYRNYDGRKSGFGETSVSAAAPQPDQLSAFAAQRARDKALTVMLVNKMAAASSTSVQLANFSAAPKAAVYQLTATNAIARLGDATVSGGQTLLSLPAQSITLLVVPRGTPALPALSVGDVTVQEGNRGSTWARIPLTLSAASATPVAVSYATRNGTATAGRDYRAVSGRLTFPAGSRSRIVSVAVLGDTAVEGAETFALDLSLPQAATLAKSSGTVTIRNDDGPGAAPRD